MEDGSILTSSVDLRIINVHLLLCKPVHRQLIVIILVHFLNSWFFLGLLFLIELFLLAVSEQRFVNIETTILSFSILIC